MKRGEPNRVANIWVARAVPVVVLAIIGYGSWVVTKVLCVDYLLRPPASSIAPRRPGPAAAILTLYYLLLCMMVISYARLLYVVTIHPGLVPRGRQWYVERDEKRRQRQSGSGRRRRDTVEKSKGLESSSLTMSAARKTARDADLRVEDFWQRETFTCNYDGRPAFCSTCYNWKPDRSHHCKELDRCVLKMDHFCPWVGGVVSETSFKFFVQFTFWAALFCTHAMVSVAYYLADRRRLEHVVNANLAVALGIAALFLFFSAGMCMSSLQFVFINSTTIENLSRKTKIWYLAVHVPDDVLQQLNQRGRHNLRLITYPRPLSEQFQVLEQNGAEIPQEVRDQAAEPDSDPNHNQEARTFAILETSPGTNPFDLGPIKNFTDIMGDNIVDWLLPVRFSPCVGHESTESFYKTGPGIRRLKQEAGIVGPSQDVQARHRQPKHKTRKRSSRHRSQTRSRSHSHSHSHSHSQQTDVG